MLETTLSQLEKMTKLFSDFQHILNKNQYYSFNQFGSSFNTEVSFYLPAAPISTATFTKM